LPSLTSSHCGNSEAPTDRLLSTGHTARRRRRGEPSLSTRCTNCCASRQSDMLSSTLFTLLESQQTSLAPLHGRGQVVVIIVHSMTAASCSDLVAMASSPRLCYSLLSRSSSETARCCSSSPVCRHQGGHPEYIQHRLVYALVASVRNPSKYLALELEDQDNIASRFTFERSSKSKSALIRPPCRSHRVVHSVRVCRIHFHRTSRASLRVGLAQDDGKVAELRILRHNCEARAASFSSLSSPMRDA